MANGSDIASTMITVGVTSYVLIAIAQLLVEMILDIVKFLHG